MLALVLVIVLKNFLRTNFKFLTTLSNESLVLVLVVVIEKYSLKSPFFPIFVDGQNQSCYRVLQNS